MGYREDDEKRIKEWKDLQESGLKGGPRMPNLPRWAWIAIIVCIVWVAGMILHILDSPSKPKTRAPPYDAADAPPAPGSANHIDTLVPTPRKATIKARVQGVANTPGTMSCTYDSGTQVTVWETVGDMARVSSACETWVPVGSLAFN